MTGYSTLRGGSFERVMARVNVTGDCWLYSGPKKNKYGYAQVSATVDGATRRLAVHRVVYEHLVGAIGGDLELDHLCRTPSCVNPAHLEPVSHAENNRRRRSVACPKGHAREGNARPSGACRTCAVDAATARNRLYPLRPCVSCGKQSRAKSGTCKACQETEVAR